MKKLVQNINDMEAVVVIFFRIFDSLDSFRIIRQNINMATNGKMFFVLCPVGKNGISGKLCNTQMTAALTHIAELPHLDWLRGP